MLLECAVCVCEFYPVKGLGDLAEARRIVQAHCESDIKEKTLNMFRLFRPPNIEALAKSPFAEEPETEEVKLVPCKVPLRRGARDRGGKTSAF